MDETTYVEFEYQGKRYKVNDLARFTGKVVLPDHTVIKTSPWERGATPGKFVDNNSFSSLISSITLDEQAKIENAYIAILIS